MTTSKRRVSWWLNAIEHAGLIVRMGGIVVYPTDTVYGIGGSPWLEYAVERVFRVKRRPPDKPVPLLVVSVESALEIGEFDEAARRLAERFWPGALTIVVPLRDTSIPELVTAGTGCVGLRMPAHPAPRLLAMYAGGAIIGTSANISGMPSKRDIDSVLLELGDDDVDYFLDGGVLLGSPSTVLNLCKSPPRIERLGPVPPEAIERVAGIKVVT
ncbi:Sua5/YciO/YrdC/YwlC family protein [Pyrolobus fumarii 1A]|uniref:L-threonylcarbamoyladenylate synthase n=1 Tax=Pyrolobus fumarii (strain DSM 11204 / 1A) TaxID=694429 RepID=G0EH40_PYRF1|nr:L-threonylcarbamoyladenylate synthase [Pyrolobus fumarii]AEM39264.1 Sua5/YciO/YrdC/YwlC family protein [Pyrolobus fumarii 1A]